MPKNSNRVASVLRASKIKAQALDHANKVAKPGSPEWMKAFEKRHHELVLQLKDG
jgi:hypothetical protein